MLNFESNWRYYSQGEIPIEFRSEISQIISKISRGDQGIIEHFKRYFAAASGTTSSWSTSLSWADSDLQEYMIEAANNAPLYIEALYEACEKLKETRADIPVPDVDILNKLLAKYNTNYLIAPPNLLKVNGHQKLALTDEVPVSLDKSARDAITDSLTEANRLLLEGRNKQAVQEILWLLETVTTVYRGSSTANNTTIQGKYFNKIIGEIRKYNKGNSTDQIIGWIENLHGYLSAPAGGGIRHGSDLREGIAMSRNEAVLYCNLITSYINFLLMEYDKITVK